MNRLPGPTLRADVSCIDRGTLGLHLAQVRQPTGVVPAARARDELTPIARWMAHEINRNAASADAQKMRELNSYSLEACIGETREWPWWQQLLAGSQWNESCVNRSMSTKAAALMAWGLKVRQDGAWDHKPIIARRFNPANPGGEQHYHRYEDRVYFYDVWSNLHYGFVGRACGFSAAELLDGAGIEQIASDLLRGNGPQASPGVQGMRQYDHPQDRVAVEIGVDLFAARADGVEPQTVVSRIVAKRHSLQTRPYAP